MMHRSMPTSLSCDVTIRVYQRHSYSLTCLGKSCLCDSVSFEFRPIMEEVFSVPPPSCNHLKPADDPHLLCRRCRTCKFFTMECEVCHVMASDTKTRIERTWHTLDLRQALRTRSEDAGGRGSSVEAVVSSSSGSHCSDSGASKTGLVTHATRARFLPAGKVPSLLDHPMAPASTPVARAAENAALGKSLRVGDTAFPCAPTPSIGSF